MSEDQLNAFLQALKADMGLQEKLKSAGDLEAVVEIANSAGFAIAADDLEKAQSEISDQELERMAGGVNANPFYTMVPNECNPPVDPPKPVPDWSHQGLA